MVWFTKFYTQSFLTFNEASDSRVSVMLRWFCVAVLLCALLVPSDTAQLDYRLSHGIGSVCAITRTPAVCDDLSSEPCFDCAAPGACSHGTLAYDADFRCFIPTSGRWSLQNSTVVDIKRMRLDPRGLLSVFIAPTIKTPPLLSGVGGLVRPQDYYRVDLLKTMVDTPSGYYDILRVDPSVGPDQSPDQLWARPAELPESVTLPVPHNAPTIRAPSLSETQKHFYSGDFFVDDSSTTRWTNRLNAIQPSTLCNASAMFFLYKPIPMPSRIQPFESLRKRLQYKWRVPGDYQLLSRARVSNYLGAQVVQPQMPPYNPAVYTQQPLWPGSVTAGSPFACTKLPPFFSVGACSNQFFYDVTVGAGPDSGTDEPVMAQFLTMSWAKPALVDCAATGYCAPVQGQYTDEFVDLGILPQVDGGWNSKGVYQDVGAGSPFVGTVTWLRHPGCTDPYVNLVVPGAGNTNITAPAYVEWQNEEAATWTDPSGPTTWDYRGKLGRVVNVNGLNQEELTPRDPEARPLYTPERLQFFDAWCRITANSANWNLSDPAQLERYLDFTGGVIQPAFDPASTSAVVHIHHVDGVPSDNYNMWAQLWSMPTPVPLTGITPPNPPPTPRQLLLDASSMFGAGSPPNLVKNNEFRQYAVTFPDTLGGWSSDNGQFVSRRFNPLNPLRVEYLVSEAAQAVPACRCVYSDLEVTRLGDVVCVNNVTRQLVPNASVLRKPATTRGLSTPVKTCSLRFSDDTPFSTYDSIFDVYSVEQNQIYTIESVYVDGDTVKGSFNAADLRFGWYISAVGAQSVQLVTTESLGLGAGSDGISNSTSTTTSSNNGLLISSDTVSFKALADAFIVFKLNLDIRSPLTRVTTRCSLNIIAGRSCSRSYVAYSAQGGATGATSDENLDTLKVTVEPGEIVQLETWIKNVADLSVQQISWSWNLLDAIPITSYSSAVLLDNTQKRAKFYATQEGSFGVVAVVTQTQTSNIQCTSVTLVEINVVNSSIADLRTAAPPPLNLTTSCLGTAGNLTGPDQNSTRYVEADAPPPFNYLPIAAVLFDDDDTFTFSALGRLLARVLSSSDFNLGPGADDEINTPVGVVTPLLIGIVTGSVVTGLLVFWLLRGMGVFTAVGQQLRACCKSSASRTAGCCRRKHKPKRRTQGQATSAAL